MSTHKTLRVISISLIAIGIAWGIVEVVIIGGLRDRVQELEHRVDVLENTPKEK